MLNVKTLTDTMSRMPLPQLQQYAALHKNDPYIVTLALSIANQKKQMQAGKAGQAGMVPQPKVVDQQISDMAAVDPMGNVTGAQMLPEDTGIGQLPAQNMRRMAEGGIVAFDDGGYTFGAEAEFGGLSPLQTAPLTPAQLARIKLEKERQKNMAMARAEGANMRPTPATDPRLLGATPLEQTVGTLPLPPGTQPPAPPAPPTGIKAAVPVAAKPVAPVDPMAGIKALDTSTKTPEQAKAEAAQLSDSSELRNRLEANEKFTSQAYDKLLGDYDKKVAELPEAYKGYEARLQKEEAEAATDKDKALGMAIFQAGLGMMSGTSQYAFENIGKGALAGLDNYQAALKDLKKAQRERDKAFADIEAARLAEKRGDIKAHTELQAKGIEALGAAKNRTVEGIAKIFDVDTRTATGIFETSLKDKAQNERTMYTTGAEIGKQRMADAAALQRTQIQASAPSPEERILSNDKLFKKKMDLLTAATGMRGDTAIRETWAKSPYLQAQFPNVDDYVRMMSGTTGSGGEFKVLGSRPAP